MSTIASIISRDTQIKFPEVWPSFDKDLSDFLKYVNLKKEFEQELSQRTPLIKSLNVLDIPTFLGLEIEVENMHDEIPLPKFLAEKQDHSLREGGKEYTTVPLTPEQAMVAIIALWLFMKKLSPKKKPEFSWRTSDHVHLNVLDLDEEEFRSLLVLGVLFEPLFFAFAGNDRKDSVFCVPLTQSRVKNSLNSYLRKKESFKATATAWPKYTAINLCRLYQFPYSTEASSHQQPALGTLEFRHLGGTPDPTTLIEWLTLILRLFRAAIGTNTKEILEIVNGLTTPQAYHSFAKKILGTTIKIPDTTTPVAIVKDLFVSGPKLGPIKPKSSLNSFLVSKYKKKTPKQLITFDPF